MEHAALSAVRPRGLEDKLSELGLNRPQIGAGVGNIVARMAQPCIKPAAHAWLKDPSALGELIDFDVEAMDLNRLYCASHALYKHREALQEHLFGQALEGVAAGVSKAKRGHSKARRSDCPQVTLAMALDASGFLRRVQFFAGNASEPTTLKGMLMGLHAARGRRCSVPRPTAPRRCSVRADRAGSIARAAMAALIACWAPARDGISSATPVATRRR